MPITSQDRSRLTGRNKQREAKASLFFVLRKIMVNKICRFVNYTWKDGVKVNASLPSMVNKNGLEINHVLGIDESLKLGQERIIGIKETDR